MNTNFFQNLVEQKLLTLHTCYLAKVTAVNGGVANVQPLSLIKAVGGTAKRQAPVHNVPISKTVLYCIEQSGDDLQGKVVVVACMERDISQTRKGLFALPSLRRHSLSDSVIIGVI